MTSNWFQSFKSGQTKDHSEKKLILYTFHHAGGACQYFQPWVSKLPNWIELISVQLPGRWNRVKEPAFLRMEELIPELGIEFEKQIMQNPEQNFALYGHSLGGLIAYELTRYLTLQKLPLPVYLFISAKRTLQHPQSNIPIYELPILEFEKKVAELYGALPPEIASDPDMKAMFLNITKIDMELLDTYKYQPQPIINVPMTIIGGASDHVITLEYLLGWKDLTSANCEILQLPGGHFFLRDSEKELLELIVNTLMKYNIA